jgi:hypothetical protein
MPNSINRFDVVSTNNKAEDKWFVFTLIAIVSLAATLLYWQANDNAKQVKILPKEISPLINQLSSSADEISFLIAGDLLPAKPSLLQLQQAFIPPFDNRAFSNPTTGCFLTDVASYQVALWLNDKGHQLAWRDQGSGHDHDTEHGAKNDANNTEHQCQQIEQGWQLIQDNTAESTHVKNTQLERVNVEQSRVERNSLESKGAAAHS